jgi:hypothetical protein
MGLPLYVTCVFSFAVFRIFVVCAECFDYNVSAGVSLLVLKVWCSISFLHVGDSLFLEVREVLCYYSIE